MDANVFILRNWAEYFKLLKEPYGHYEYSFMLSMHEESLRENYLLLSELKINFTITLEISEPVNEKQLQSVFSFLFLPYYQTPNLYVKVAHAEMYEGVHRTFSDYFNIQKMDINLVCIQQHVNCPGGMPDVNFIICDQLNELKKLERQHQENFIVNDEAGLLRIENNRLQKHIQLLTAELEVQKGYNEKLRQGHQAQEIQSYYDQQYEMLPAWYKKIGNIIKRLMK